jgi:hypothetical protein
MLDPLAASYKKVTDEDGTFGAHPPRALRVESMLESLSRTGHQAEIDGLRSRWEQAYGPTRQLMDYKNDIALVVGSIHAGPYGGIALTGLVNFPQASRRVCGRSDNRRYAALLLICDATWIQPSSSRARNGCTRIRNRVDCPTRTTKSSSKLSEKAPRNTVNVGYEPMPDRG